MTPKRLYPLHLPTHQRGVTTLLVTMVLLVVITFVSLYTSRTVLMEQKISANEYRSRMAFEAAEAGIEAAMNAIGQGWTRVADTNADTDTIPDLVATNIVFDSDSSDSATGNSNSATLNDGSSVVVTLEDVSWESATSKLIATRVVSVGTSNDGSATRTINQVVALVNPLPNIPDTPMLTKGGVVIGGSATVYNPEGHSTIWTGGDVDLGSNNSTATEIANPTDANYPDCLGGSVTCDTVRSSDRYSPGIDIIEHDTSLSNLTKNEFFENFFGEPPAPYKDSRVKVVYSSANVANASGQTDTPIWIEGDPTPEINGGTFGTDTDPIIMIIDGDVTLRGNPVFKGLLFVTGDVNIAGNVDVHGSMVVQGNNNTTSGSLDIWYNSGLLKATLNDGLPTGGGGSWRDF